MCPWCRLKGFAVGLSQTVTGGRTRPVQKVGEAVHRLVEQARSCGPAWPTKERRPGITACPRHPCREKYVFQPGLSARIDQAYLIYPLHTPLSRSGVWAEHGLVHFFDHGKACDIPLHLGHRAGHHP